MKENDESKKNNDNDFDKEVEKSFELPPDAENAEVINLSDKVEKSSKSENFLVEPVRVLSDAIKDGWTHWADKKYDTNKFKISKKHKQIERDRKERQLAFFIFMGLIVSIVIIATVLSIKKMLTPELATIFSSLFGISAFGAGSNSPKKPSAK